jgi:hypothetical protein
MNSHNMKNLFIINEEEKNRILNLHETATNRQYLPEQQVKKGLPGDPYEYKLENGVYSFKNVKKGETQWTTANANQSSIIKTKIFKDLSTSNRETNQTIKSSGEKQTDSPFKSRDWGNHFRLWVNQNLPQVATKFKLSKKGPHNNKNIIDTWNYDLPLKSGKTMKLGEYYKLKNTDLELKSKIESNYFPVPQKIGGSDRINKELLYISKRKEFNGKPFFIADPLHNLVLAFDEKHKLIDYSQSISGADKQPDEVFTYEDWCKASNLEYDSFRKRCVGEKINSAADSNKAKSATPNYSILAKISMRGQKEGVYRVSSSRYEPGYKGKSGIENLFHLETQDGAQVGTAIHALVKIPNRIKADTELSNFLQKEKNFGKIPKEYINAVEKLTSKYDLSAGCFNVSPEFANNPKVIAIAKQKAFVFIMSERKENFLVQVTPDKQDDFFVGLKGDGKSCKSMESIGVKVGGQGIETSIA